jgi:hypothetical protein
VVIGRMGGEGICNRIVRITITGGGGRGHYEYDTHVYSQYTQFTTAFQKTSPLCRLVSLFVHA